MYAGTYWYLLVLTMYLGTFCKHRRYSWKFVPPVPESWFSLPAAKPHQKSRIVNIYNTNPGVKGIFSPD